MTTAIHFWSHLAQFFLQWETFPTNVVQKFKSHILYSINFFSKIMPFFEITWKNIVESGRPQITIWRMRVACWITKAMYTHSEYVALIAFPLQQWLQESAWISHSVLPVLLYITFLPWRWFTDWKSPLNLWHWIRCKM
jgi:hypothetical protein